MNLYIDLVQISVWLIILGNFQRTEANAFVNHKIHTCNKKPNIVFIVADDAGWNDFSFHGSPQIPTPNIDALALNGIILNDYYGSPLCTPTRGSILTGKHPIHIRLQHYVITGGQEDGLPLEEKILPQYLKEFGYATHLVGKWHLGHARHLYTPTYRGFDSHFGNWLGMQDYYDHFYYEKIGFGYDMRKNMEVNYDAFGNYTTDLYTKEALRIIQTHPTEKPLFLMINHIAPHAANGYQPLQAPYENVQKFNQIQDEQRRIYAGMVDKLDESVGIIVEGLKNAEMLENSIVVFTSDNGGSPEGHGNNYGSNWPLRGVKNTLWEGGTRLASFIWSIALPQKVSKNLMHVQDWLPTLIHAIGGNVTTLQNIDGISQWPFDETSKRDEMLYNIDDVYNNSAIRRGQWKVIQGNSSNFDLGAKVHWDSWYGPSGRSNETSVYNLIPKIRWSKAGKALTKIGVTFNTSKIQTQQHNADVKCIKPVMPRICDPYNHPCLFNIHEDPCEFNNVAQEHPEILQSLLKSIKTYNLTAEPPLRRYNYPQASPIYWGYAWTNWLDKLHT